jgi:hypothetical protein
MKLRMLEIGAAIAEKTLPHMEKFATALDNMTLSTSSGLAAAKAQFKAWGLSLAETAGAVGEFVGMKFIEGLGIGLEHIGKRVSEWQSKHPVLGPILTAGTPQGWITQAQGRGLQSLGKTTEPFSSVADRWSNAFGSADAIKRSEALNNRPPMVQRQLLDVLRNIEKNTDPFAEPLVIY